MAAPWLRNEPQGVSIGKALRMTVSFFRDKRLCAGRTVHPQAAPPPPFFSLDAPSPRRVGRVLPRPTYAPRRPDRAAAVPRPRSVCHMARATKQDLVRVYGLTSDAGRRLNGCVGCVVTDEPTGERVGVVISSETAPWSIKWSNLEIIPGVMSGSARNSFSNGVGRESMCGLTFTARSMLCTGPPELVSERFDGDCCARSRGNLTVVTRLLCAGKLPPGVACVFLTDLNVVRAVNLAAVGASVALASTVEPELKALVEALKRRSGPLIAQFSPHRCIPDLQRVDTTGGTGESRIAAVKDGSFLFYPALARKDSIEVRFLCHEEGIAYQERFLDYGRGEALAYARSAAALDDSSRLLPLALAKVDPQAFWAALLRFDAFCATLDEVAPAAAEAWRSLAGGVRQASEAAKDLPGKLCGACPWGMVEEDGWDLSTEKKRKEVAVAGFNAGQLLMLQAHADHLEDTPGRGSRNLVIHTDPDAKGTAIEESLEMQRIYEQLAREKQRTASGRLSKADRKACLRGMLQQLSLDTSLDRCGHCATVEKKLYPCAGCEDVAYCASWH